MFEAEAKASRPRPKFWPQCHFGLEDNISGIKWRMHSFSSGVTAGLQSDIDSPGTRFTESSYNEIYFRIILRQY